MSKVTISAYQRGLIALAFFAYLLPWSVNSNASMTHTAFDLAEWTSLHPQAHDNLLLIPLSLRVLPMLYVAFLATIPTPSRWLKWLQVSFAVVVSLGLLPPLEFFISGFADVNHRQQLVLATMTLMICPLFLLNRQQLFRWQSGLRLALIIAIAFAALIGLVTSRSLIEGFQLVPTIGAGGVATLIFVVCLGTIEVFKTNEASADRMPRNLSIGEV
jgi:hypothetical protein